MESLEQKIGFSTSLLDLPMEMLIHLGAYLKLEDILNFRSYSRYSREAGNAMLSNLREITITNTFPCNKMQLRMIAHQCHRLRKIHILLVGNKCIYTDEYIEWFSNIPLLEEIELRDMTCLTSRVMVTLATKCKNLMKLTLWNYPCYELLDTLNVHINHLVEVNFFCSIDFPFIMRLSKIRELLYYQPKLQRIFLPTPPIRIEIIEFYAKILSTIADVCKELTYLGNLILEFCQLCTLRKIVENCPKLTRIDFNRVFHGELHESNEMLSYLKSKNIEVKIEITA